MEARVAVERPPTGGRLPVWFLAAAPLALIAALVAILAATGAGLGDRRGPPIEDLAVERTNLTPGRIELHLRNDGPDPVRLAQVVVNDAFVAFQASAGEVGRLGSERVSIRYPWIEGEAYEISLLTSTGATITHEIEAAAESPSNDLGFFGLMALLGIYVGVIPVTIGMFWLPFVRQVGERWLQVLMAVTVGLLAFLAIDASLEGIETAAEGAQVFGGPGLVFLGAALAYLALAGVDSHLRERRKGSAVGSYVALLVAIGIGLHNLGEGLAIGSAYSIGALALGTFLVVGFAIHNTTEGLAIVAPMAARGASLRRLAALGLIAGAPAILGAWIGAAAFNASLSAFLLGVGAGAIVQVIQQLVPAIRDRAGRVLHPPAVGGIVAGMAILYATSLLVSV
jgi:zinc transporter, ZIP family